MCAYMAHELTLWLVQLPFQVAGHEDSMLETLSSCLAKLETAYRQCRERSTAAEDDIGRHVQNFIEGQINIVEESVKQCQAWGNL